MERRALRCLRWGIFFTFIDFRIGQWNLLPEFVGMLLFYGSIRSHKEPAPGEERVAPLFLVLAADGFLHWIWRFENTVEALVALADSLNALNVLLVEVAGRIRPGQPDRAAGLEVLRVCAVVLQCAVFLVSPFELQWLNSLLTVSVVAVCIALLVAVCRIRPEEDMQG